jgi:uncharacterized protein YcnI
MRLTLIAAMSIGASMPAAAHVTVWPKQSVAGAHEKYVVRVPNEGHAAMITVEVRFPADLRVTAVEQKPGWQAEAVRGPAGELVGVRLVGSLPPEEFVEFGLLAANPTKGGQLNFTAIQAFADGTKVEWSGTAASKTPAPQVTLTPAR